MPRFCILDTIPPPAITWDHVRGVFSPALLFLTNCLRESQSASQAELTVSVCVRVDTDHVLIMVQGDLILLSCHCS